MPDRLLDHLVGTAEQRQREGEAKPEKPLALADEVIR